MSACVCVVGALLVANLGLSLSHKDCPQTILILGELKIKVGVAGSSNYIKYYITQIICFDDDNVVEGRGLCILHACSITSE